MSVTKLKGTTVALGAAALLAVTPTSANAWGPVRGYARGGWGYSPVCYAPRLVVACPPTVCYAPPLAYPGVVIGGPVVGLGYPGVVVGRPFVGYRYPVGHLLRGRGRW